MNYKEKFEHWLHYDKLALEIRDELEAIREDEEEIKERFAIDLAFGTAGLRGILAAGSNRMNIYTVRRTTQGLALYIKEEHIESPKVAIAYDSRHKSAEFALEAAKVLCANGIHVYLYDELKPTPMLSFAVRELDCISGIVITASHNPAKYNGYKVYGDDGAQISPEIADKIIEKIDALDFFDDILLLSEKDALDQGLLSYIGEEMQEKYIGKVLKQQIHTDVISRTKDFKIIYTPFHGTGNKPVRETFDKIGLKNVLLVQEQIEPDGDFPTVKSPNPEEKEGFTLAIEMAKQNDVDLIIGTDPDCDRVGIVVKDEKSGEYIVLTGNQTGALLTEYILSQRTAMGTMPPNPYVIKTIVTSEIIQAICDDYNVELFNVLTGFKFIGEIIKRYEKTGEKNYVFGFEESYGYLAGTYARDKDAVVASMLIAEMAAYYHLQDMSLYDALQALFKKYGTYCEGVKNIYREGLEGISEIKNMMSAVRNNIPVQLGDYSVKAYRDYSTGIRHCMADGKEEPTNLPKSNVLYFELEGGGWAVLRPSGTEPKLKVYTCVNAKNKEEATQKAENVLNGMLALLEI